MLFCQGLIGPSIILLIQVNWITSLTLVVCLGNITTLNSVASGHFVFARPSIVIRARSERSASHTFLFK
jgi:hypothetical protein